ncbi:hypothetical protein LEMLEM_LOCUS17912 [Lemmus lemmus]
MGTSGFWLCL